MKVIINGTGIAGPTLAYWLLRFGHEPTLVERAPELRTGGYVIDFWGVGYDVAERMGLRPELEAAGYKVSEVRLVDTNGRKVGSMPTKVFGDLTDGRYMSLPRGDLAAAIYGNLDGRVETLFSNSITAIEQHDDGVHVGFEHGEDRQFDVVIGADGLHSTVRQQVFGEQVTFEKYLGYTVAAFEVTGYQPRDELVYISYTRPGRQLARFAQRGDKTMFMFIYATDTGALVEHHDTASQKAAIHAEFDGLGWECAEILSCMDECQELYFDRVSQIHMDTWSKGRVALIGDAAFCASLLAGQGSALAMTAAYVLAGELHRAGGDHQAAFARYEAMLHPFLIGKQTAAEKFASAFAPKTEFGLFLRNKITSLMRIPLVAKLAMSKSLIDRFELPDYGDG